MNALPRSMLLGAFAALSLFFLSSLPPVVWAETTSGTFFLVDAERGITLRRLREGDKVELAAVPKNISIIFVPESPSVRSVTFELNGYPRFRHETTPPFSLTGDAEGRYHAWSPRIGKNEITARADGQPPESSRITFSVVENGSGERDLDTTEARVREFIDLHHERSQGNDLDEILELYDERVDYYDRGVVDRATVRRDKLAYLERWPARRYDIGEVRIHDTDKADEKRVVFYSNYSVGGRGRSGDGRARNEFTLRLDSDTPKIVAEHSEVVTSGGGGEERRAPTESEVMSANSEVYSNTPKRSNSVR